MDNKTTKYKYLHNRNVVNKLINITKSLICRVCLKDGEIPIFGDSEHEDISTILSNFTDILINKGDRLPKYLCSCCYALLEGAVLLNNTAQISHETLTKCTKFSIKNDLFVNLVDGNESKDVSKQLHTALDKDITENIKNQQENPVTLNFISPKQPPTIEENCCIFDDVDKEEIISQEKKIAIFPIPVVVKLKPDHENNARAVIKEPFLIKSGPQNIDIVVQEIIKVEKCPKSLIVQQNPKQEINAKTGCKEPLLTELDPHIINKVEEKPINISQEQNLVKCPQSLVVKLHPQENKIPTKIEGDSCIFYGTGNKEIIIKKQPIQCPLCPEICERIVFKAHFNKHPGSSDMKIVCTICGRLYKKTYYVKHIKSHFTESICDHCGKVFYTNSSLNRHKVKHFPIYPYKCPQCNYRAKSTYSLKYHIFTHTKERSVMCSECGKIISSRTNYKKHVLMHQGKRDFECDTCNRRFYSRGDLKEHIKVEHLGIKEFVCFCGAAFGRKMTMRTHERIVHKRAHLPKGGPTYLLFEKSQDENSISNVENTLNIYHTLGRPVNPPVPLAELKKQTFT